VKKLTRGVNTIVFGSVSFVRRYGLWLFAVTISSSVFAAPNDWNGSVGSNWSNASNWNTLPANGADLNFGALTATNTTANNNSFLTSIDSITFQGAQTFTLQGSALTIGTGNVNHIAIINNSSNTQTIGFGGTGLTLATGTVQRWDAASGGLTIASKVVLNGTSLGIFGGGTVSLNSAISGNGNSSQTASLVIGDFAGVGHVVLKGNNSGLNAPGSGNPYSVSLLAGSLTIGNVNALGTGALLIDHSGNNGAQDTLGTTGNFSISNSIDTRNSFVFAPIGTFQIKGNLTLDTSKGITAFTLSNSASQASNYVDFNGVIQESAASSLTFNGGGRFALSGASANTYTGLTTVTGGTQLELRKTGGALAMNGDLTVNAGSKVQLEGGNNEIDTTATMTMNGILDFNGNAQTVKTLTDDGTASGFLRFGSGGQLTINGSTNSSFSGVIQDDGAEAGVLELDKQGSGTLLLTGNNTYTGTTKLEAGALQVGSDTALGVGNVTVTGGTLSTNGVEHTINVGGVYDQTGGTLSLTLLTAANNSNEKLAVTGTGSSTLGGNLAINGNNLTVMPNLTYNLATFTNGYAGTFNASITNLNLAGLIPAYDYTTNAVTLTFLQSLASVNGLTPNQHSVSIYIDSFAPNAFAIGGNFQTLVTNLSQLSGSPAALGSALDQISPQSLQIWRHIAFDNSTFSNQLVINHLANLRDGVTGFDGSQFTYTDSTLDPLLAQIKSRMLAWSPASTPGLMSDVADPILAGVKMSDPKDMKADIKIAPPNSWSTFVAGNVILADLSHDQDLAHQDYTTSSITAGADYHLDPNWTVGGLLAYGHTDATLDHIGSSTTVDSYSPGIYASYVDQSGWYGNALFSYGYNSYTEDRNIQIGALTGTNHGAPQGSQYVGNLTSGYEFKEGHWKIGPTASLQYVNLGINSFTEQGPTALNVQAQSVESLRSQLGFETRYAGHVQGWFGSFDLTPHFSATWQHEYIDEAGGITSQFNQLGVGSFTIQTTGTERDSAFIDAGLDAQIEDDITLFGDYLTQVGQNHYYAQSIQAGLKIAF